MDTNENNPKYFTNGGGDVLLSLENAMGSDESFQFCGGSLR